MRSREELDDLTTHCIRCGFCLESCPTFVLSGEETESPRGRIYLVRSVIEGKLTWPEIAEPLDHCLGCRNCETACPSGVEYGAILELARERLPKNASQRLAVGLVSNTPLLKSSLLASRLTGLRAIPKPLASRLSPEPALAVTPTPQKRAGWALPGKLPPVRGRVVLLEGCAMGTLFPRVHEATVYLLRLLGFEAQLTGSACCGALHAHVGDRGGAAERLEGLKRVLNKDLPILTNSAGCGSHLKEALDGYQLSDVSEFFIKEGLLELLRARKVSRPGSPITTPATWRMGNGLLTHRAIC